MAAKPEFVCSTCSKKTVRPNLCSNCYREKITDAAMNEVVSIPGLLAERQEVLFESLEHLQTLSYEIKRLETLFYKISRNLESSIIDYDGKKWVINSAHNDTICVSALNKTGLTANEADEYIDLRNIDKRDISIIKLSDIRNIHAKWRENNV